MRWEGRASYGVVVVVVVVVVRGRGRGRGGGRCGGLGDSQGGVVLGMYGGS